MRSDKEAEQCCPVVPGSRYGDVVPALQYLADVIKNGLGGTPKS